jgi:hypothetical protein
LDKVEVRNCFDGFIEYYSNFTTADGLKAPSISNAWDIPDIKGISLCYRTARLLNARQKLEDIADFLGAKWAKLGESAHYDKGEKFIAQAPGILHELRMALMSEEAWVRGFNNVQKLDESYWNAKCAGFFGLERFSSVLNRQGFPNQFGSDSCFLPGAGGRHGWDSLFQWICARA